MTEDRRRGAGDDGPTDGGRHHSSSVVRSPTENQEAIFRFLAEPSTHGGAAVKRIDTHAAAVFLAGPAAYKVKRAVKFPFLDFSTREKRRAALDAEIEANRPFTPELYIGLIPIVRRNGALAFSDEGDAVEWALKMHRFDEEKTLDHLADAGRIDHALIEALARTIAVAHARAPVVDAGRWIAALGDYIDQDDQELRERPDLFDRGRVEALTAASRAALARVRPLLVARGARGLVRRGHGDLHLGNIALIDGRPVPFDALEFDSVVASGDVLYDLAFLLMDLVERKLNEAANIVLNVYLGATHRFERSRCAGGSAVVHVAARRNPRQGDGGETSQRPRYRSRSDRSRGARLFRACA